MQDFLNKKIYILGALILLFVVGIYYFVFSKNDYTNYPSKGTDIVAFGDSLIEGVGASSKSTNLVSLLSKRIGKPIVNLGISGNTTADGLNRLSELDKYNPKVVIILLGGNDYLRKVPEETTFKNLDKIIDDVHKRGSSVLLLGVRGGILKDNFNDNFEELADNNNVAFVSNVLSGLILDKKYMADEIHPNDEGYKKIVERVYPMLKELIKE